VSNPNAKPPLTSMQVALIKSKAAAGETENAIAAEFGISQATVSRILNGTAYSQSRGGTHFRNLHLVDGQITWRELRDAALEYDECALPDHPSFETALDFAVWLKAEIRGVRDDQAA
jgi:hypothetical protein